jgi:hypothetical protein
VYKIRAHLRFNNVPYTCCTRQGKKRPTSVSYTKIPSLRVGDRRVNDSFVIITSLLPHLYNLQPDDDAGGNAGGHSGSLLEWEEMLTFGLQLAMEVELFEDPASAGPILGMAGYPSCLASCCCCLLPLGAPGKPLPKRIRASRAEKDDKYGPLKTTAEYLSKIKSAIGAGGLIGNDKPGAADVSAFATLKSFADVCPTLHGWIREAGIAPWFDTMEKAMPTGPGELLSDDKWLPDDGK